jgi:hypothetical protein
MSPSSDGSARWDLAASAIDAPEPSTDSNSDLLSGEPVSIVAKALEAHREDIARGALLSIDEDGTRVRMLHLTGSQSPS